MAELAHEFSALEKRVLLLPPLVLQRPVAKLNDWLVEFERKRHDKEVLASLVCADSQSIKAGPFVSADKGIDGNKKVNGRKRHILVDVRCCFCIRETARPNIAHICSGCCACGTQTSPRSLSDNRQFFFV